MECTTKVKLNYTIYSIGDRILTKYDQYSKQEIMNYIDSRHLCSNKNIYLSESNTNNPKCYLLMQFAVNLAEKKLLN